MSSLKDDVDKTQSSWYESPSIQSRRTQNNHDMSVTSDVSHVEMWPYVASAAVASASHAVTAVRILSSPNAPSKDVGAGVTHMPPSERPRTTPHDVDSHWVSENASSRFTSS